MTPILAAVLEQLPRCAIAHFACHGFHDPADPSRSHLLLHDHAATPMTVASLGPIRLEHAQLACLSAVISHSAGPPTYTLARSLGLTQNRTGPADLTDAHPVIPAAPNKSSRSYEASSSARV